MPITSLTEVQCGTCGVVHAIPQAMYDAAKEDGGYWHCPNGHQRGFREGRKAREAVIRERDRLKQKVAELEDDNRRVSKLADAATAKAKRLQKRAHAGVCSCCNRTFSNVAAHMRTCHKGVDPNVVDLGVEKAKRA